MVCIPAGSDSTSLTRPLPDRFDRQRPGCQGQSASVPGGRPAGSKSSALARFTGADRPSDWPRVQSAEARMFRQPWDKAVSDKGVMSDKGVRNLFSSWSGQRCQTKVSGTFSLPGQRCVWAGEYGCQTRQRCQEPFLFLDKAVSGLGSTVSRWPARIPAQRKYERVHITRFRLPGFQVRLCHFDEREG